MPLYGCRRITFDVSETWEIIELDPVEKLLHWKIRNPCKKCRDTFASRSLVKRLIFDLSNKMDLPWQSHWRDSYSRRTKRTFASLRLSEIKNWFLPEKYLEYLEERIVLDKIQRHEFFFHFFCWKILIRCVFIPGLIREVETNLCKIPTIEYVILVRSLSNLRFVFYGSLL